MMIRVKKLMSTSSAHNALPRLPIPSLESSISKFIESIKHHPKQDITEAATAASEFLSGVGNKLQETLVEYDKSQKNSWLEQIWLSKAYLEWREPLPINSNWFMVLKDPTKITSQVKRAAQIIYLATQYKLQIVDIQRGKVEVSKDGKKMFCMNQLQCMFENNRIPGQCKDNLIIDLQSPSICQSNYVICLINNQMFKLDVLKKDFTQYSIAELEVALNEMLNNSNSKYPPIPCLTHLKRDDWYNFRNKLLASNQQLLNLIDHSLFHLSLDGQEQKPMELNDKAKAIFCRDNRWYDKTLSFVVLSDGTAGLLGEHSPCDAVIPGRILEYIYNNENEVYERKEKEDKMEYPCYKPLQWKDIDETVEKKSNLARAELIKAANLIDLTILHINENNLGSDKIKIEAQCSPDTFVQVALQLAFYHWKNEDRIPYATYETASTRMFSHGRTDVIRVSCLESLNFCRTFFKATTTNKDKIKTFYKFADKHMLLSKEASRGNGIDRHFLGLKVMAIENDIPIPEIFKAKSFVRSGTQWELSTSNMSPGTQFQGLGFGPAMEGGLGINYAIDKSTIKFSICTSRSPELSVVGVNQSEMFSRILKTTIDNLFSLLSGHKSKY